MSLNVRVIKKEIGIQRARLLKEGKHECEKKIKEMQWAASVARGYVNQAKFKRAKRKLKTFVKMITTETQLNNMVLK